MKNKAADGEMDPGPRQASRECPQLALRNDTIDKNPQCDCTHWSVYGSFSCKGIIGRLRKIDGHPIKVRRFFGLLERGHGQEGHRNSDRDHVWRRDNEVYHPKFSFWFSMMGRLFRFG